VAGFIIAVVMIAFALVGLYIISAAVGISINLSIEGIIAVFMATIFMTIFNMLVFELSDNRQAAIVITGVNAILQSYMSGCIIPSTLLPVKVAQIGEYLPASYIKKSFRLFITRRKDDLQSIVMGLAIWCVILFFIAVIVLKLKEGIQPKSEKKIGFKGNDRYHIPSLPTVVLKRFIHKKSVWICLVIIAVFSVLIVRTERKSDSVIKVAFYDESGEYLDILEGYEGLVNFVGFESEDDVKRAVLKDEVECGYIIPADITSSMISQVSNGIVTVYQDDDAVAVAVVNEVIYEMIFENVSLKWYEGYITKMDEEINGNIENIFEEKLNEGITFDIDICRIGAKTDENYIEEESAATFPVQLVAILIVVICGIYGIIQVRADMRKKRFYRCNKISIYTLTILIPIMFGIITGITIITIIVNMWQYSY
jgi:hypothetical protein